MTRKRLPNRRDNDTVVFEHDGIRYHATASFIDGQLAEVFLDGPKAGSLASMVARESAVLLSLALQHGTPVSVLREALPKLPNGAPAGPMGAALFAIDHIIANVRA